MKITSITTEEFKWPRRVPIRNGKHTYTHSGLGLVKIETDENVTGIGLGGTGLVGQATIEGLKHEHDTLPQRVEGSADAGWILMDYLDVIVHIFTPQTRDFYRLEQLWGEAPARVAGE